MQERSTTRGSWTNRILAGTAGTLCVGTLSMLVVHESASSEPAEPRHCTAVPNLPEALPPEDVDEAAIQKGLELRASQLHKVAKFAATCYVPEGQELQFSIGQPIRADLFEPFGVLFDKCIVYGVPTRLIPIVDNETSPGVVACIGSTTVEQV